MFNRMGRQVTTQQGIPLPEALAGVALIDGPTSARGGQMSVSAWHDLVRSGVAPKPVIRRPRYTRWRLVDVVDFWQRFAAEGTVDARVVTAATKASAKAREKRNGAAA